MPRSEHLHHVALGKVRADESSTRDILVKDPKRVLVSLPVVIHKEAFPLPLEEIRPLVFRGEVLDNPLR